MNNTLKTVLLTVLTLSLFTIAMIELSGVSQTALFNKLGISEKNSKTVDPLSEQQQKEQEVKNKPKTTFEMPETNFDFGTINEGDKVKHVYKIKNTGTNPLFIANIQTSCGCTAPEFPKEPIAPGAEGDITIQFNSAGKEGKVKKNSLVICNAPNSPFSFSFTADVKK